MKQKTAYEAPLCEFYSDMVQQPLAASALTLPDINWNTPANW